MNHLRAFICALGGSPSIPSAPPPPPPPPNPPTIASSAVSQAGAQERTRLAAAAGSGFGETIASSPEGAAPAATVQKQLLGA